MIQKAVSAAERKKDYHAGPGNSFPIGPAGEHLRAAWDLAGHAANPDEVRSNIIRFAQEHGLVDHLPQSARDYMKQKTVKKARQGDIAELFSMAWSHESMEGDTSEKRRLIRFAEQHQLTHLLPEDAHGLMHEMQVPHNHDGVANDENGIHEHVVVKAFDPVSKFTGYIVKSWGDGDIHFEGWMSTNTRDQQKDITEPTAFDPALEGYFSRRAPLSLEHGLKTVPIGHLQKAAIIVDGKVLKSFSHPSDPGEFEHLPDSGSGVWTLGAINEPPGKEAIKKGNIGGMSFIANAREKVPLPGGGYRYLKFDPLIESTIAAYPINPDAVVSVVKAFGLQEPPQEEPMTKTLEEILAEAAAAKQAELEALNAQTITKADLGSILGEFKTQLMSEVVEEVKKAFPTQPAEGQGRRGTITQASPTDERDADPVSYLVKKAAASEPEWDDTDKELILRLTVQELMRGLE